MKTKKQKKAKHLIVFYKFFPISSSHDDSFNVAGGVHLSTYHGKRNSLNMIYHVIFEIRFSLRIKCIQIWFQVFIQLEIPRRYIGVPWQPRKCEWLEIFMSSNCCLNRTVDRRLYIRESAILNARDVR